MILEYELCAGACCKNPWGTCLHRRMCAHHLSPEADHRARQTHKDPTGNQAVNNIMREQRRNRR